MSLTDDWNHMVLVESNSSCDNIARNPPLPKKVSLCLMSQSFRKDCNWRRSISGWGQEQSDHDFQKVHAGSVEEIVLPPNSQIHIITIIQPWRMAYSIFLWGSLFHVLWWCGGGGEGASWTVTVKQILGPLSECFHFFFLLCPAQIEPMDDYFSSNASHDLCDGCIGHQRLSFLNIPKNCRMNNCSMLKKKIVVDEKFPAVFLNCQILMLFFLNVF